MKTLLGDEALRARLSASGRERARLFSWEKAVSQIHAAYMRALGVDGPPAVA
jgi:hypothetical protein